MITNNRRIELKFFRDNTLNRRNHHSFLYPQFSPHEFYVCVYGSLIPLNQSLLCSLKD